MPFSIFGNRKPYSTPPFNPQMGTPPYADPGVSGRPQQTTGGGILERLLGSQPNYGGILDPEMQAQLAKQQQSEFLLNLGAGFLSGSQSGQGFAPIAGQALQGALAQRRQSMDDQIRNLLLVKQVKRQEEADKRAAEIGKGDIVAVMGEDGTPQYVKASEALGKRPYAEGFKPGGQLGNFNPGDYTPESLARFLETNNVSDLQRYVTPAAPSVQVIGGVPTDVQLSRTGGQPRVTPLGTLESEEDAKRRLAGAESSGSVAGKVDAERAATFQQDLGVIDDEILRTQRLLTEFKEGKYQTGPIAGRLPSMRDAAQDLEREQARDVLKNISSATFGALSEGERDFLKGIGIDPKKNEGSNVTYLEEKLSALQEAKKRLQTRGPVEIPGQGSAPKSGGRPPLSSFRK